MVAEDRGWCEFQIGWSPASAQADERRMKNFVSHPPHLGLPFGPGLGKYVSASLGAVSSVVEHYLDTVGVTGSNPVSRTIFISV